MSPQRRGTSGSPPQNDGTVDRWRQGAPKLLRTTAILSAVSAIPPLALAVALMSGVLGDPWFIGQFVVLMVLTASALVFWLAARTRRGDLRSATALGILYALFAAYWANAIATVDRTDWPAYHPIGWGMLALCTVTAVTAIAGRLTAR